jgi:hypothetical protein
MSPMFMCVSFVLVHNPVHFLDVCMIHCCELTLLYFFPFINASVYLLLCLCMI